MKGSYLESLTWVKAGEIFKTDPVILLPIGAQAKQHGPHLPLNTDWLTAKYLTRQIVERLPVIALPTVAYGYYPAFIDYPGSTTTDKETFAATIVQIVHSIARHGPQRFYLLNTGISTNWALEPVRLQLIEDNIRLCYTDLTNILTELENNIAEQPRGSHADEMETSMMLYMHPDKVKMELAVTEVAPSLGPGPFTRNRTSTTGVISPSGSWGDPTLASAEKGKILVEALVAAIVDEIQQLGGPDFRPAPPNARYL